MLDSPLWGAKCISTFSEREVSRTLKSWCQLLVIVLGWGWEEQTQVHFSKQNQLPILLILLLPLTRVSYVCFPHSLLSSWEDPSRSSFCGLSVSVRQFHNEAAEWWALTMSQCHPEHLPQACGTNGRYVAVKGFLTSFWGSVVSCWLVAGRGNLSHPSEPFLYTSSPDRTRITKSTILGDRFCHSVLSLLHPVQGAKKILRMSYKLFEFQPIIS